jgi:hypothetical protein
MSKTITGTISCGVCHYPIQATYKGELIKCPYCGSINEAIGQVTIPTSLFVGVAFFLAGVFLGPSFMAATKGGSEYLARLAREHIK